MKKRKKNRFIFFPMLFALCPLQQTQIEKQKCNINQSMYQGAFYTLPFAPCP